MMRNMYVTQKSNARTISFPSAPLSIATLLAFIIAYYALISPNVVAQTAPPPAFGEDTKGKPAIPETDTQVSEPATPNTAAKVSDEKEEADGEQSFADNLLGEATITESRRENGQLYLIELEHSSGSKQYIEENDSDGKLSADGTDPEDEPILPKWKLGSW